MIAEANAVLNGAASDVLALYEHEQRIHVQFHGMRTEQTPDIVRLVALDGSRGAVIYSRLDASSADRVIREQIEYFAQHGMDFGWKVYHHDQPPDLRDRLTAAGFEPDEPETIMVLALAEAPASLFTPISHDIRWVTEVGQIADVVRVLTDVWGEDQSEFGAVLAEEFTHTGDDLRIGLAYVDGVPACTAWIRFHPGAQMAGLWGGSSLPAYRQRGLYTALLAARAQEARRRGVRYLTIDAGPMSAPIVAKLGFRPLAIAQDFNWQAGEPGRRPSGS